MLKTSVKLILILMILIHMYLAAKAESVELYDVASYEVLWAIFLAMFFLSSDDKVKG